MNIYEKLSAVQQELKAPKDKKNTFGGYNYRSAEGILEAVKPVLKKYKAAVLLSDEITATGNRIYVKATAEFLDQESINDSVHVTAYAREAEQKKGMDESQITGTASSYARKYALNGLFCIDDTKDSDTEESRGRDQAGPICEGCGREIKDIRSNGTVYPAAEIVLKARDNYGKDLCWTCMREAKKQRAAQ